MLWGGAGRVRAQVCSGSISSTSQVCDYSNNCVDQTVSFACQPTGTACLARVMISNCSADAFGNCTSQVYQDTWQACDSTNTDSGSGCGNAAWPGCSGWCPSGYACISGSSQPCRCHAIQSCSDILTQSPPDIVVTRISPTAANVAWNPLANNANIYKRHLSVCDFGTPTNGCPVNQDVPATMTNMDVMNLIPGEMYVVKIAYSASSGNLDCSSSSITYYLSSCELKPDPKNIPTIGADWTKMTTQINRVRSIDDYYQINYSTANSNIVQIATNWTVRQLWPYYYTLVKGLKSGTTTVKNVVNIWVSGTKQWIPVCDYKATVNVGSAIVTSNGAWWQAVG